jgi:hypothetical protein
MAVHLQQLVATRPPRHCVTIVSYEGLYEHGAELCTSSGVDLLVVDEAHCLANDGERAKALRKVPTRARLLLTGTPHNFWPKRGAPCHVRYTCAASSTHRSIASHGITRQI